MKVLYKLIVIISIFFIPFVYAIDSVRINMEVNNDSIKKLFVIDTNNEEATLKLPKSGSIPKSRYGYNLKLSNIDTEFEHDNDNIFIKKGNNIRIKYDYDVAFLQDNGMSYYVLFDGIDKDVDRMDFSIKFVQDIDDLKFYINGKQYNKIDYYVNNNSISGSLKKKLNSNDVLSFSVNTGRSNNYSLLTKFSIVFPIISLITSFIIWLLFGKDRKVVIEETMHPDKRLSLLDVARLYKGNVEKKDVLLLVFSLCHKGYIKIVEEEDDIRLVRLKNYNGHCYSEGILFDAIFTPDRIGSLSEIVERKKKVDFLDSVSVKDVMVRKTIERILKNENLNDKKNEYYERNTKNKSNIINALSIINLLLITCNPFISLEHSPYLIIGVLVSIFSFILVYYFVKLVQLDKLYDYKIYISVGCFFLVLILGFLLGTRSIYQLIYFIGIVCVIIMMIIAKYMPKKTIYGSNLYNKMESFKYFINHCNNDKVNTLLDVNPDYYYDIIEYTYFYNNKNDVSKKFKNSGPCKWYESYKEFRFSKFNNICDIVLELLKEKN